MKLATLTVNGRAVLGSFGKGVPGSVTLNFATSGGANCDRECAYHPESTNEAAGSVRCYAASCENRHDRKELRAKLERHEATDAAEIISRASLEMALRGYFAPWFRFSAFGSVPAAVPGNLRDFLARLAAAPDFAAPASPSTATSTAAATTDSSASSSSQNPPSPLSPWQPHELLLLPVQQDALIPAAESVALVDHWNRTPSFNGVPVTARHCRG